MTPPRRSGRGADEGTPGISRKVRHDRRVARHGILPDFQVVLGDLEPRQIRRRVTDRAERPRAIRDEDAALPRSRVLAVQVHLEALALGLNTHNGQIVYAAVAEAFDAIIDRWLDAGFDGFRIDVAQGLVKDAALRSNPEIARFDPAAPRRQQWAAFEHRYDIVQPESLDVFRRWRRRCSTPWMVRPRV